MRTIKEILADADSCRKHFDWSALYDLHSEVKRDYPNEVTLAESLRDSAVSLYHMEEAMFGML